VSSSKSCDFHGGPKQVDVKLVAITITATITRWTAPSLPGRRTLDDTSSVVRTSALM
jgi:hypothetical protein